MRRCKRELFHNYSQGLYLNGGVSEREVPRHLQIGSKVMQGVVIVKLLSRL